MIDQTSESLLVKQGDPTIGEIWEVFGKNASVPVLLQGRQLNTDYLLLLGRQLLQHIFLQPPKQVWRQQLVQLAYLQTINTAPEAW